MSTPIRFRLLTATPVEEWAAPFKFPVLWVGSRSDGPPGGRAAGTSATTATLDTTPADLGGNPSGTSTISGELDPLVGRSARTSALVAVQNASDARVARTASQVAVQSASDARAARTSTLVAIQGASDARSARVSALVAVPNEFLITVELTGSTHCVATASAGVSGQPGEVVGVTLRGVASATGTLFTRADAFGDSDGVGGASATLDSVANLEVSAAGETSVAVHLYNEPPTNELSGTSAGTSTLAPTIDDYGPWLFSTTGCTETWTVPTYFEVIRISVWGAGGGGGGGTNYGDGGRGGGGGFSRATFSLGAGDVDGGDELTICVGEGGSGIDGGYAGKGAGGGGYSAVKNGSAPLIAAGSGGGGSGNSSAKLGLNGGSGGGLTGGSGSGSKGGGGGTQTAGGSAYGAAETGDAWAGGDGSNGSSHVGDGGGGGTPGGGSGAYAGGLNLNGAGGGGGAGYYGGGGGGGAHDGGASGGGGGSNYLISTGRDQTNLQAFGATGDGAGQGETGHPGGGVGDGGAGGTPSVRRGIDGGDGYVYIEYVPFVFAGNPAGETAVQGTLDSLADSHILDPIPYDLSATDLGDRELIGTSTGRSFVVGLTQIVRDPPVAPSGKATVTGTLSNFDAVVMEGTADGTTIVTGTLLNGAGGVYPIELEGKADGVAYIVSPVFLDRPNGTPTDPVNQRRHLYLMTNVGVGYCGCGVSDRDSPGTYVTSTCVDGDVCEDFPRHLFQFTNVGVSFEGSDLEDGPGVNPTYTWPDGNTWEDFPRHLYEYLHVIEELSEPGRLTIGPAPSRPTFLPPAKPPVSRVGRGPEVV